jgi:VanZ family protein
MHTLGGIFIALLGAMVCWRHIKHLGWHDTAVALLLFVLIIGLAWEYFEYIVQFFVKGVHLADIPDSITDLMCDMLGGIIGTAFVLRAKKRYNRVHARNLDK